MGPQPPGEQDGASTASLLQLSLLRTVQTGTRVTTAAAAAAVSCVCSSIERGMYAQGWEALREIRGPFYEDTYAEFMSIVRAAAAAPQVRQRLCIYCSHSCC